MRPLGGILEPFPGLKDSFLRYGRERMQYGDYG